MLPPLSSTLSNCKVIEMLVVDTRRGVSGLVGTDEAKMTAEKGEY